MFQDLIDDLIDALSDSASLSNISFYNAFNHSKRKNPINSSTVYLNFGGAKITNGAFGDFIGENRLNEFFGKQGKFSISFDIFSPVSSDGKNCCDIFTLISDVLLFEQTVLNVISVDCGEISYDRENNAFFLRCTAEFKLLLSKQESNTLINNIIVT